MPFPMNFSTESTSSLKYGGHYRREIAAAADDRAALLEGLNFSDARAVELAHQGLQSLSLALFPAEFFDGVDRDRLAHALAALMLFQEAEQQYETTACITPRPQEALKTLIGRLTPIGQDALFQSVENPQDENVFSKYLAEADRYCLAGHLYLARAYTYRRTGGNAERPGDAGPQAAEDSRQAGHAWLQSAEFYTYQDEPRLAVDALRWAAHAFTRANEPEEAIAVWRRVAELYADLDEHVLAGDAWGSIAAIYQDLKMHDLTADANRRAGLAYKRAAHGSTEAHQPLLAAANYMRAAFALQAGGKVAQAFACFVKAAHIFLESDLPAAAAEAYQWAEQYGRAVAPCMKAAIAFMETNGVSLAADAYVQLGLFLDLAGRPKGDVVAAYLKAVQLWQKMGEQPALPNGADWQINRFDIEPALSDRNF